MKLFVAFSRAYPAQSALVLGALVLASLFEGVGLTTLLPLLSRGAEASSTTGLGGVVTRLLAFFGLTPTVGVLLCIVVGVGVLAVAAGQPGPEVLRDTAATLFPVFYIGMPLGSLAAIRLYTGAEGTLLLIVTMIVSDSAQYYAGRSFGRRPLAASISPKKTIEGAVGGLLFGTAAMSTGGLWIFPDASRVVLVLASALVVAVGMIGDLFESLLKRSAGVKDSSNLIPGHGGILDRIDSWLFAGPIYYVFARYFQTP
jgi:phosphatidate cytidylyltransferase